MRHFELQIQGVKYSDVIGTTQTRPCYSSLQGTWGIQRDL